LADIRALIEAARQYTARTVNAAMVVLYWSVGRRIREDILHQQRAEYGKQTISTLSKELTAEYGRGYSEPNLSRMMRLAEAFPDEKVLSALSKELSWSHFVEIIALDDPLKREFYAEMCRAERWSTRTLRDQVKRMVYERTAVSKKPEEAIELKIGRFQAADKGQMELYLRWLEEHETHPDEEPPIGLILCAGKSEEQVRLLRLEAAGSRVAEYLTELPPREMLERKLHDAIILAREQLARQTERGSQPGSCRCPDRRRQGPGRACPDGLSRRGWPWVGFGGRCVRQQRS
jgi:hypothetical protein